jgi:hypothetical protein
VQRGYKEDNRGNQVNFVREAVKRGFCAEAEESPLLEAVTREQLVKTKQAGTGLDMLICELWT